MHTYIHTHIYIYIVSNYFLKLLGLLKNHQIKTWVNIYIYIILINGVIILN